MIVLKYISCSLQLNHCKKWEVAYQVFLQFYLNTENQLFTALVLAWKYAHTYHKKGSGFEGEAANELSLQG